jgi:hypothetical protein
MKSRPMKFGILLMTGILVLTGCTTKLPAQEQDKSGDKPVKMPIAAPAVEETTEALEETTANPASGTSLAITDPNAKAMAFDRQIEGIVKITLTNLDGNVIDKTFSDTEIEAIKAAFNESYIMDTAYIEMIAGATMTITLEDGREVFIHSYGDENFIVARIGEGETYHLGCTLIGKILLESYE